MKRLKMGFIPLILLFVNFQAYAQPGYAGEWKKTRLYGHSFNSGDFSDEGYDWIRDHFEYFTIEKTHLRAVYGNPSHEETSRLTATKLIKANPRCKPLMIYSIGGAYPHLFESEAEILNTNPDYFTYDADGDPKSLNLDNSGENDWYIKTTNWNTDNSDLVGIFLDGYKGAYTGHTDNVQYISDRMTGFRLVNGMDFTPDGTSIRGWPECLGYSDGVFIDSFFRRRVMSKDAGVVLMDACIAIPNDQMFVCFSAYDGYSPTFEFSHAAYLIVANENTYYRWVDSGHLWSDQSLMTWHDVWDKEMGEPLGKAVKNGYVYTRRFKYCKVKVDVENITSSIIWGSTVPRGENIALNGVATQSSTNGGEASLAIDGNTNGDVAQTNSESNAWWQVDLGANYSIGEVSLNNIAVGNSKDFTVYVLNDNGDTTYTRYYMHAPDTTFLFDADGAMGKIIRVQSHVTSALSIAEVEVFQYQYAIDFTATDSHSSQGIKDVSFTINGNNYITNQKGETRAYLNEGVQDVTISKPGYISKAMSVNLPSDTLASVELEKKSCDFKFNVKDKATGSIIQGASIEVNNSLYTTNDQGAVSINDLWSDVYPYTITKDGYDLYSSSINLVMDTSITVEMIPKKANLGFHVKDAQTEEAISYASILINETFSLTNTQGDFKLEWERGEYTYKVSKDGYDDVAGSISLEKDTTVVIAMSSITSVSNLNELGIKIYPNPASTILNVKGLPKDEDFNYQIINVVGDIVKKGGVTGSLDITQLYPGMYFMKLKDNKGKMYQQIFIKQ